MGAAISKYIEEYFKVYVEKHGLIKKSELNEGQDYCVEYASEFIVLKVEKYRSQFYPVIYKTNSSENGVSLFTLLDYLYKDKAPISQYFSGEIIIEECYRKQILYIATIFDKYFNVIIDFFISENCESNLSDITNYVIKKHPELFKRVGDK